MDELNLTTLRQQLTDQPWNLGGCFDGEMYHQYVSPEIVLRLLDRLKMLQECEYWGRLIRQITGEPYTEPRDAYRTACGLSERLQEAEKRYDDLVQQIVGTLPG